MLGQANVVMINEAEESTPLGRAEWLKLVGALTGGEAAANKEFAKIEAKYNTAVTAAQAATGRPTVFASR